jgi:hypothetical protein
VPINCEPTLTVVGDATFLAAGLCETVLITHGESGRSGVGRTRNVVAPTSLAGQFEQPYADGAADFVHDPGVALHEVFPWTSRKAAHGSEQGGG